MTSAIVVAIVAAALVGLFIGGRHLYLRLDRPGGFECSLRVVRGEVPGIGPKFRAGYAGPEPGRLFWRRVARPGPGVRIPLGACRVDQARRARRGERLSVPSTFSIIPVEFDPDTTLELALPDRKIRKLVGMLSNTGEPRRRRR